MNAYQIAIAVLLFYVIFLLVMYFFFGINKKKTPERFPEFEAMPDKSPIPLGAWCSPKATPLDEGNYKTLVNINGKINSQLMHWDGEKWRYPHYRNVSAFQHRSWFRPA